MKFTTKREYNNYKARIRRKLNGYVDYKHYYEFYNISGLGDSDYFIIIHQAGNVKIFQQKLQEFAEENDYSLFPQDDGSFLLGKNDSVFLTEYKKYNDRLFEFEIHDGSFAEILSDRLLDLKDDFDVSYKLKLELFFFPKNGNPYFCLYILFTKSSTRRQVINKIKETVKILAPLFQFKYSFGNNYHSQAIFEGLDCISIDLVPH